MSNGDNVRLGVTLRIASGALFAGMVICVKAVSEDIPLGEIVFFRSAFAIIPLIIFLWLRREFPQGLATKRPFDHLLRASLGATALFASFAAIARLNLAETVLIAQLSPIIMAMAALLLLRERLTVWRIGGLVFGFAGVVVMVWPEIGGGAAQDARLLGFALALLSAILGALALIMVRSLNRTESPGSIALYFVLASMLGALVTLPAGWVVPSGWTLALLVGAGLFGGFGQRQELCVAKHDPRFAMIKDIGDRVGVEPRVDGVEHRAAGGHAEMRLSLRGQVWDQRGHHIAGFDPALMQGGGQLRDPRVVLSVAVATAAVDQRFLARKDRFGTVKVAQRGERHVVCGAFVQPGLV